MIATLSYIYFFDKVKRIYLISTEKKRQCYNGNVSLKKLLTSILYNYPVTSRLHVFMVSYWLHKKSYGFEK